MKKYLSVIVAVVMLISIICMAGCGKGENQDNETTTQPTTQEQGVKFGVGSFSAMTAADAEDESFPGEASLTTTVAAVILDENGRIISCKLDSIESAIAFNVKGEVQTPTESKSKYEQGYDYMMSVYGIWNDVNGDGVVKEWFEQADAFCNVAKGKTLDELKAFVAETGKTSGELSTAGCTVNSYDFIKAVEKAVNNATVTTANENDTISLGFAPSAKTTNATADEKGNIEISFTISAVTLDENNKITDAWLDMATCTVEIDNKGVATTAGNKISTKKELGDNYHMASYGTDLNGDGVVLEWYKQAEVFENACIGKTADEISALVVNGYQGNAEVQSAGCTIAVSDFAKAMIKASTVA